MVEYGSVWTRLKQKLKWLDPFSYSDLLLEKINPDKHWYIEFPVELATAFLSAFLLYVFIGFVLGTNMPIVVVVSGSMEPVFSRGDVVVLQGVTSKTLKVQEITVPFALKEKPFFAFGNPNYFLNEQNKQEIFSITVQDQNIRFDQSGDSVVYFSRFNNEPIIHRAVLLIHASDGDFLLTKGDSANNTTFDQDCGRVVLGFPEKSCITPYPVPISEVRGKAVGWIPVIGYVKLILVDDLLQLLRGCPPTSLCAKGCCFP